MRAAFSRSRGSTWQGKKHAHELASFQSGTGREGGYRMWAGPNPKPGKRRPCHLVRSLHHQMPKFLEGMWGFPGDTRTDQEALPIHADGSRQQAGGLQVQVQVMVPGDAHPRCTPTLPLKHVPLGPADWMSEGPRTLFHDMK